MFAMFVLTLAIVQAGPPECRDVRVKGARGRYRTVLMCRSEDGRWRTATAAAPTQHAAPAVVAAPTPEPTPVPVAASTPTSNDCNPQQARRSGFGSFLGRVVGDVAGNAAGRVPLPLSYNTRYSLNTLVSDAIACRLRPGERDQAATATNRVVAQPVGTSSTWRSTERPNVTGSSTVTTQTAMSNGTVCKDVRDVATIDGEETAVTKRMCRAPGAAGYTVVRA